MTVFEYLQSCTKEQFAEEMFKALNMPLTDTFKTCLLDMLSKEHILKRYQSQSRTKLAEMFIGLKGIAEPTIEQIAEMVMYFDTEYGEAIVKIPKIADVVEVFGMPEMSLKTNKLMQ